MFCAECGTKNEVGAQFCESCGQKLENEVVTTATTVAPKESKSFSTKFKEMSTKNKIIAVVSTLVVVALVVLYFVLGNMTKPEVIAEKFFNASMSYDTDTVYGFIDAGESAFTTKEMFKKVSLKDVKEDEIPKVLNYTVGEPRTSVDGLSTTVTITYVLEGKDNSQTADIKLVKAKENKWLLFDNWKVNVTGTEIVNGYQIKVMKGSKLTVEGVEVDKKYIDSKESSESLDVYSMPSMFGAKYDIKITLPIGVELEDDINVRKDSYYKYSLSLSGLTDKVQEKLKTAVKTNVQAIYSGVTEKKSFDDIKSTFEYKGADLTELKDAYEDLVDDISDSITLTKVNIKEVKLSSVSINSDDNLYVYAKVTYDYSLTYQSGEETKTNEENDYDYMYLTFDYANNSFKLVDAYSLNTYFSKY